MTIRTAIIGCGAIASIHAANAIRDRDVELTAVYSANPEEASIFASLHGIKYVGESIADTVAETDAAIVCSPSNLHFQQACECLEAGVHTLVEFPPCTNASEAEALGGLARERGKRLGCAHTSRYLLPYAGITDALRKGILGEIEEVNYVRYHQLRARNWSDNALLHHAAHPIDLLIDWCGGLDPIGCVALPHTSAAQTVSILAKLPNGGPAAITVSYVSRLHYTRMSIVGKKHTVETDGFSYVRSDLEDLQFRGIEQDIYERAVRDQDAEFFGACQGRNSFMDWDVTVKLVRTMDQFQALGDG